ncbi:trypsin-like serine protease [Lacibacterium aquatile]|uniref:Trypsin-like serine protease n=1 Tax=Lacibacterium aquatile TaxID=1168082 RepID=A0ABW5DUE1_9PROT
MPAKPLLLALCVALSAVPAGAVVILDSTWKQEGGTPKKPGAGFGAHIRLANQPQFSGLVSFSSDGESWGEASGTWIGNDDKHAYILTAGHVYELPAKADDYVVRSPSGKTLKVDKVWTHPRWNGDLESRSGFDLAIVRLEKPIMDAGQPPLLYRGEGEAGQLITFVGFGTRGIGSKGEDERYNEGTGKAAAQGIVDEWTDLDRQAGRNGDAGNFLGVYLPREDGKVENPFGGDTRPASPLVGLLGAGDSGGSAWLQIEGKWVIVGVNSNGDGNAQYGDASWFTRVSPHGDWIARIFPGARFTEDSTPETTDTVEVRPSRSKRAGSGSNSGGEDSGGGSNNVRPATQGVKGN